MFRLPKHTKMVQENFYSLMLKQIYIIILSTIFSKGILSCAPPSTGPPFSSSSGANSRFYGQSRASRQQFYPSPTIIDVQQNQKQQQFPLLNGNIQQQQLISPRADDTYLKEKQTMQQQTFDSREHFLNDFGNNDIDVSTSADASSLADQNLQPPVNSSESSDLSLLEPSPKATQPAGAYLNKLMILPSPQMAAAFKQENVPISHEHEQKLPTSIAAAADDKSSSSAGLFVPLDCPQNGVHNYTELLNCLEVEVKPFDGLASHSAGHELPVPSPEQNCQFEDDSQEEKCSFYSTVDGSLQFNLGRLDAIADLKNHHKFAESFAILMRRPRGDVPIGNFLVLIEPESSNNPRSEAILKMDVLCQHGDGKLMFSYWCTYEHLSLKVCTQHGLQRDCTTQIFYTPETSRAEVNVVNPAPISSDSRFTVEIIASGFNEPAILLLDNLRYEANPCTTSEPETHKNPKDNVERIAEAKIFTPNLNILPIVRVEDEELEMFTQPDSDVQTLSAQQNAVTISDRQEKKITQVAPSEILSEEAPWLNRNLFTSAPKMWPLPIKNTTKNGSSTNSNNSKNGWHQQLMESSPFQREMLKLMGAGQQQKAAQQQHFSQISAANNLASSQSLMSDEKLEEKKSKKTSAEAKKEQQKHNNNGKLVDGEVSKKLKWWQQQQSKNMNTKEQEEKGLWRHVEKDAKSNEQQTPKSLEEYESKLHRPLLLLGRKNEQQQKRMRLVPILRRRKQPLSACELLECTFNTGFCHYTQIENGGKYRLGKWRIARPLPTNINMRSREASSYSSIENVTSTANNNSLQYFGYAYVGGYANKGHQQHQAIGKKSDEQRKSSMFTVNRFGRTLYILQSPDISLNSSALLKFDVFQRSAAAAMPTKLQICLNSMMRCVYEKMFPSTDDEDHHYATAAGDVDGWRRDEFVELPAETKRIFIVATQWKNNGNGASGWLAIDNIRLEAQTTTKQNEQQNCSL